MTDSEVSRIYSRLKMTPPDHPQHLHLCSELAIAVHRRFLAERNFDDLDYSIKAHRNVMGARTIGADLYDRHAAMLGAALLEKYRLSRDSDTLNEAIQAHEYAIANPDNFKPYALLLLAEAYAIRYRLQRAPSDNSHAIRRFEQAASGIPATSPAFPELINNYANSLRDKYELSGVRAHLDQAILILRHLFLQADLAVTSSHHTPAATLASSLADRYRRDGDPADLDEALSRYSWLMDQALEVEDNELAIRTGFASALRERFHRDGSVVDIEKAAAILRSVVQLTSLDSPDRPPRLGNLAIIHSDLFELRGKPRDLEIAIALLDQAEKLLSADDPEWTEIRSSSAACLVQRWNLLRAPDDLNTAIIIFEKVVHATPEESWLYPQRLHNLSEIYMRRYAAFGRLEDAGSALRLNAQVVGLQTATITLVAQAARSTIAALCDPTLPPGAQGKLVRLAGAGDGAVALSGVVIPNLVREVLSRIEAIGATLTPTAWLTALGQVQGLAADGAYQSALEHDLAGAARLVERGCAVIAGARQSQQEAVLDLLTAAGHGNSVAAYRNAVVAVTNLTATPDPDPEQLATLLTTLTKSRAALEPLWGAPLAPQATPDQITRNTTTHGPVTYLIATEHGGLALTLTPPSYTINGTGQEGDPDPEDPLVQATWLPELTSTNATSWVNTLTTPHHDADETGDRTPHRTVTTWRKAAATPTPSSATTSVVDHLTSALRPLADAGIALAGPAGVARIVPVGALAQLSLTPALTTLLTPPTAPTPIGIALAGSAKLHILATTTRTLTSLGHTNQDTPTTTHTPTSAAPRTHALVAVTNPRTCTWAGHDQPALPAATREGDHLHQRYGATHHTHEHATRDNLLDAFTNPDVTVIHLALHGDTPPWAPDTAHLLLADQPTTTNAGNVAASAGTVTATDLPALLHHDLIFLNSCWTGKPGTTLPDEAQSLPTALITAGAHTVIAPLWPVHDDAAAHLASVFYNAWQTQGHPPPTALAIAQQATLHHAQNQHADGKFNDADLQAWTTTTHAYTCTGTGT